jgi:hypothetical protein
VSAAEGGHDVKPVQPLLRAGLKLAIENATAMVELLDRANTEGVDSVMLRREVAAQCNHVARVGRLLRLEEMRFIKEKANQ